VTRSATESACQGTQQRGMLAPRLGLELTAIIHDTARTSRTAIAQTITPNDLGTIALLQQWSAVLDIPALVRFLN
jgi:hypothetical protein